MRYLKLSYFLAKMPPKQISLQGKPIAKPAEKQTKLFSKQVVEQPSKIKKTKSKQFVQSSPIKDQNHTKHWEYGSGITPEKLLISSWNVNGVRAVIEKKELDNYIKKTNPDILCLSETKIDFEAFQKKRIVIDGYHGYWNFCKCSAGYSGVAIFSKYLPLSMTQDLSEKEHSQEGRVITMEFQKFYLVTAYIPNAGQKLDRLKYRVEQFDKSFQRHCNDLKQKKTVVVCGDLNVSHKQIDIANPKSNYKTAGFTAQQRQSFSEFLSSGWIDTFRSFYPQTVKYSWWSMRTGGRAKNIGWRLDYFLIDEKSMKIVKDSMINNEVYGSDHCPVELSIELN